ncbi:MAG TPA: ATP-binding protein [Flavobacteriales bacterium]|nr:ATP-binding protein [Flavobacteriales bacterium]
MRFNRPFELGLLAFSTVFFSLVVVLVPLKLTEIVIISWGLIFLVSLSVGALCFLVVNWSVNKFLYGKVKLIYKTILSQKLRRDDKKNISVNPRLLDEVHDKVEDWVEVNNSEIEKLKEQEAFRREFLGNLAHELKTPVFSIQGYILTLLEGGLEDPSVNRVFLERAASGVDRMTAILQDLDEITRLESGRTELYFRKINIVELARECMENLEMRAKEKHISLQFNHKYDKPIFVSCDKEKISQVLNNLLVNAINYGKDGGKTDVRFFDMEDKILVEVADNGLGMAQEHLPRIFERFYRVEKSRARNAGGSGLGLAIVKHIIEAHKQTINVRSTVDVGTTFTFTLDKAK